MAVPNRTTDPAVLATLIEGEPAVGSVLAAAADQTVYLVGGSVRDALLGLSGPGPDLDLALDGPVADVARGLDPNALLHERFDTAELEIDGRSVDIARTRTEQYPHPGALPVVAPARIEDDLQRRDFTINGLFYDPLEHRIIDFVGGEADLASGVLRTIGSATARFGEDKLRMLRAVRFATTLDITIETETFKAIREHAADIHAVSGERIGAEMRRVMIASRAADGLMHLHNSGLSKYVLPEWDNVDQVRVRQLLDNVNTIEQPLNSHDRFCISLALVLSNDINAAESLNTIVNRWKLANDEQRPVAFSLQHWQQLATADTLKWSQLQPILNDRDRDIALRTAHVCVVTDGIAQQGMRRCIAATAWPRQQLDPPPLLTGSDLQRSGIPTGPIFRKILDRVRDAQLDGEITTAAEAMNLAQQVLAATT